MTPRQIDFLAARYRLGARPKDARMDDRRPETPDSDAQRSVRRLIDLIQVMLPDRPKVALAIERCIVALVVDEMRERITARLQGFTPEEITLVDALTAQLAQQRGDEPLVPPDDHDRDHD